ncbi:sigma-70 family RNA polymerase sigma factor [Synechococcus sp. EJ6-Ellesmere]|uniref:sigma-70 family RNA polymerase sigma factor n=1 Tax=Synechococcus sp. EJ6-Ellesmere TaxID=2823734 RepID=UPI0020CDBD70|nr:sigma-70 family RNA polymerase sigma factor [Synechococcus sp. EJ6-Ellesmere]MCP9824499.1 sigma-70 family RNA polymerase sigma factor [Synechococcus sp. EJ6-Ellesmere]
MKRNDAVTAWLNHAGRYPLLTAEQEISLGRQIRRWQDYEGGPDAAPAPIRRRGIRARDRMVACNLRLCAAAERRCARGGEQADRLQAAALGLIRAAERFDPERGYKFSTYAYFWLRKGITRLIETSPSSSGVRIPPTWRGTPEGGIFERPAMRLNHGQVGADGLEGQSLVDALRDDRPAPDLACREALEAMLAADPDGLALLELTHHEGHNQTELAALEGTHKTAISQRICSVRQRFRRMPEVAAVLG